MAVRREDRAAKYVRIGVGQGERRRFSMGVAVVRQAREERTRNESCILVIAVRSRLGRVLG